MSDPETTYDTEQNGISSNHISIQEIGDSPETRIVPDQQTTDATTQMEAETAPVPTTAQHISMAKDIEAFAEECEADVGEAWYAFKEFVRTKIGGSASGAPKTQTSTEETNAA